MLQNCTFDWEFSVKSSLKVQLNLFNFCSQNQDLVKAWKMCSHWWWGLERGARPWKPGKRKWCTWMQLSHSVQLSHCDHCTTVPLRNCGHPKKRKELVHVCATLPPPPPTPPLSRWEKTLSTKSTNFAKSALSLDDLMAHLVATSLFVCLQAMDTGRQVCPTTQ